MALSFVNKFTGGDGINATNFNITLSGILAGDLLVCIPYTQSTAGYNTPTGFTIVNAFGPPGSLYLFTKIAVGGETTVNISNGSSGTAQRKGGIIYQFRGHNPTTPISIYNWATDGGSGTFANGITPNANSILIQAFGTGGGSSFSGYAIATSNPTWTEDYDSTLGTWGMATAHSSVRTSGAGTGNTTVINGGASNATGALIAINPGITDFPMTASQGSFTLTGQSILFSYGRKLILAFGSFTLNGQTVLFKAGRKMLASFGSFALNGQAVIFNVHVRFTTMVIGMGSFTLNGQTVLFKAGRKLILAFGSFTYTGFATLFHYGRKLILAQGSFALTGQNVLLKVGRGIIVGTGSFLLTGQTVLFKVGRKLILSVGNFMYTGFNVLFSAGRHLTLAQGSFTLTGQAIIYHLTRMMRLATGYFALTGFTVRGLLNGVSNIWNAFLPKHNSTLTGQVKHVEDWTAKPKL